MKNIFLFLFFILNQGFGQSASWHDRMYIPHGIGSGSPTEVTVLGGAPDPWYLNQEKYWYYRYRLVNDFLFIDDADGPGSSIPDKFIINYKISILCAAN